jgi:integrase
MRQQKGFVYKASGAWYVKYRDNVLVGGQVKRKLISHRLADVDDYCRTQSEAEKKAAEFLKPLNEGKLDARSTMSLTEFAEQHWLPWVETQTRQATYYGYKRTWETYLKLRFGCTAVRDVRKRDLVPFLMNLFKTGARVAKYAKSVGNMIYNFAVQLEIVESNPFSGKLLPKRKRASTYRVNLNAFSAMQHALKDDVQARACLGLMFFGALRPSEVRGLQWPDYDPRTRQILVQRSRWRNTENETKTDDATAFVPVNQPLFELLAELHEHDGRPQAGYILRGERGGSLNLDNLSRRVIAPKFKALGLSWKG